MNVYSPVSGFVDRISRHNGVQTLHIYITRHSDHRVFTPVGGLMTLLSYENGRFSHDDLYHQLSVPHTSKITWEFNENIVLSVFVGKPEYITDTVRLLQSTRLHDVSARANLAEILIGSRAELQLPDYYNIEVKAVRVKDPEELEAMDEDQLVGGQTVLARIFAPK